MNIRETNEHDFEAIAALTNTFIRDTAVHFSYELVTAAELAHQWREGRERYPWLTAETGGRFAGFAKAGVWRARTAYSWTTETSIYMEPHARGNGRGKRLYAALLDELRKRGFHSAIGGATLPNDASVRLHESLGFTYMGAAREAGHKLGKWHDVGFWQLMLRDASHIPQ